MKRFEIHNPSEPGLRRVTAMIEADNNVVFVREAGKFGTYAICTEEAAANIIAALNQYFEPKLVINRPTDEVTK